ncbi:FtsX-like permease family protein [Micromonospora sp. NPDC023737]|uniref:FtsX-like permease family protein n=1 Tax=unclassified Micromonospora TaxID=2617518 RepID=UPI0033D992AF
MTRRGRAPGAVLIGSWRVALRLAARAAARHPVRSGLVILLLLVPVYAATVLASAWAAVSVPADREAAWRLGKADMLISGGQAEEVLRDLPAGSRTILYRDGETVVASHDGSYLIREYRAVDLADPVNKGAYLVRAGRPPAAAGEIAITAALATALRVGLGDPVHAGLPERRLAVVGIVETPDKLSREALLVAPSQKLSAGGRQGFLIQLPPAAAGWHPPRGQGRTDVGYLFRDSLDPDPSEQALAAAGIAVVVAFAGAQVVLLVAAAFAVAARRQRRELGLVAAVGATGRQLTRIVLANGLVLGLFAGALGVVLGTVTVQLGRGWLQRLVDRPLAEEGIAAWQLPGIALLAVVAGLLAALGPARSVARAPVQAALANRVVTGSRGGRRLLFTGLAAIAVGITLTTWAAQPEIAGAAIVAFGSGLILMGTAACGPAVVGLAGRLAGFLPTPVRLAWRHGARHQLRTGAAVAAVCAATAGSVGLMLFTAADTRTGSATEPDARAGQILIPADAARLLNADQTRSLRQALPVQHMLRLTVADTEVGYTNSAPQPGPPPVVSQTVAVGGADIVRAMTGQEPDQAITNAIRDGHAVAFYPEFISDGRLQLNAAGQPTAIPAVLAAAPAYFRDRSVLPGALIPKETAASLGLPTRPGGVIIDTSRMPNPDELATATNIVLGAQAQASQTDVPANPVQLVAGQPANAAHPRLGPIALLLALVSGCVTLVASATAVGLATSELRGDLSTLAAIGAGPRITRWITAAHAGLVVGLGVPLGTLAGVAPAAGLIALRPDTAWHVPWPAIGVVMVLAPALAVIGSAALTKSRLVLVRQLT